MGRAYYVSGSITYLIFLAVRSPPLAKIFFLPSVLSCFAWVAKIVKLRFWKWAHDYVLSQGLQRGTAALRPAHKPCANAGQGGGLALLDFAFLKANKNRKGPRMQSLCQNN